MPNESAIGEMRERCREIRRKYYLLAEEREGVIGNMEHLQWMIDIMINQVNLHCSENGEGEETPTCSEYREWLNELRAEFSFATDHYKEVLIEFDAYSDAFEECANIYGDSTFPMYWHECFPDIPEEDPSWEI